MRSTTASILSILISSASASAGDQWAAWSNQACPNIAITATVQLQNIAGYKRDIMIAAPTAAPAQLEKRSEQGGGGGWGGGGGGGGPWGGNGWGGNGGGWGGHGGGGEFCDVRIGRIHV